MYYKVVNKSCEVYKKLHALRLGELQMQKYNDKTIVEKTGASFKIFLGDNGQQHFRRVRQYVGFKFLKPEKLDATAWKADSEHPEIFVPNKKTKSGREMNEFLMNGLKGSMYSNVFDILKINRHRKFTFPYVEIAGDVIIMYLGDGEGRQPKDKNVIEITSKEFESLRKAKK